MKLSDRLTFEADGTHLVLRDGDRIVHRVNCQITESAECAAEHYTRQMIEAEDDYEGTVEAAIEEARRIMNWTKIFCGMGVALGRAAAASERLSRSPL